MSPDCLFHPISLERLEFCEPSLARCAAYCACLMPGCLEFVFQELRNRAWDRGGQGACHGSGLLDISRVPRESWGSRRRLHGVSVCLSLSAGRRQRSRTHRCHRRSGSLWIKPQGQSVSSCSAVRLPCETRRTLPWSWSGWPCWRRTCGWSAPPCDRPVS